MCMLDIRSSCSTVNAPAWSWLTLGFISWLLAFRALEVMSGLQSSGVAPCGYNYNVIINAHLKRNDEAGALYYWQLLKQSDLQPQLIDYTSFMHYYRTKGNVRAVKVSTCILASNLCENQFKSVLGT